MRRVTVLGSTGSIGVQALEVIEANPQLFEIVGLSAGTNAEPSESGSGKAAISDRRKA